MKSIWVAITMALVFQSLLAQVPISSEANSFRGGDKLCKVQVNYVDPGECGQDATWQLGRITKKSKDFMQTVASSRDTIAIFEKGRIQHYLVHGDTLVDKGEQSRRAYCIYSQERPVLRYPFQFGDSISGSYSGNGIEEGVNTLRSGWGYSVADGTGLLTDGEDSIPHITRVHYYDEYTDTYYASDTVTLKFKRDRYSWYCAGYRYPIMESCYTVFVENDTLSEPCDSVTYMFLPVMQLDLAEDLANDSIQKKVEEADALRAKNQNNGSFAMSSVKAGLSADGTKLNITYTLDSDSEVNFCACDILGNVLGQAHYDNKEAGEWSECISLSRRPIGNATMLNIKCGDQTVSMKVNQ